jgi:hypothetical protein
MHVELHQRLLSNAAEAVDLTGLDDQNVTRASLELLAIDGPQAAALPHELDFIIGMAMGPGSTAGEGTEEEHGDIHVAVVGSDEAVRATLEGQVLLSYTVHPAGAPVDGSLRRRRTAASAKYQEAVEPSLDAAGFAEA